MGQKLIWGVLLALWSCGPSSDRRSAPGEGGQRGSGAPPSAKESTTGAQSGATAAGTEPETPDRTNASRVLFLGTSLTAGYGLGSPETEAYPAVLQQMADSAGIPARMVNAGLSGETSAGALRRADWLLRERSAVVVIETGANDGLRGLDPDSTAANLRALVAKVRTANPATRILLLQMEAPTNLGARYTSAFHAIFPKVAASEQVTLVPFFLDGVAGIAKLNQPDGIHPTAAGASRAARNVWAPLLSAISSPSRAK